MTKKKTSTKDWNIYERMNFKLGLVAFLLLMIWFSLPSHILGGANTRRCKTKYQVTRASRDIAYGTNYLKIDEKTQCVEFTNVNPPSDEQANVVICGSYRIVTCNLSR